MELYFAPMSCSLASRMAIYESDQRVAFFQVDLGSRKISDGRDYLAINPKGQVPALRTDDGHILTEGAAILQYVADQAPDSGLAPPAGAFERYQLQQWLNYIGAEIHKQVYYVYFNPTSPQEARVHAREVSLPGKYDYVSKHLASREYLLGDRFTVADAYLTTTLNWAAAAEIDLQRWPVLVDYHQRMCSRPAVAKAIGEERALRNK